MTVFLGTDSPQRRPQTAAVTPGPRPVQQHRAGRLERRGVDLVPPPQRRSSPREFLWIWHSAQFSFGTVVLGALPIVFGLSWWATVSAVLLGLLLGTLIFAPLVCFGKRTGTNDPISSGAHFGVRGRVLGNLITVLVAIGFFAIAIWTGATAMLVAGQRLLGTPTGEAALAVAMSLLAAVVAAVAVYGHDILLATYKLMTVIGAVVLVALLVVLAPQFDPGYTGGSYVLGDFWRTWLLTVSFAATLPISYSTFQGDYSRYLTPHVGDRAAIAWNGVAMYSSSAVALLVGAYVTTVLPDPTQAWVSGVAAVVPAWFAAVVVLFGLVGTVPQGALCLYAAGLSANSVFWRASRAVTTLAVSLLGVVALYLGAIVYDAVDSLSAFVLMLLVVISPWSAIMLVGLVSHRGRYEPLELHTFAVPGRRGRYWYTHGVNPRAFGAFLAAVALGVLFVDNPLYTGPLATLTGGVDLSWLVSFTSAAVLFAALEGRRARRPRLSSQSQGNTR